MNYKKIKFVIFDIYKVFCDKIHISDNLKDSYGFQLLKNNNIKIGLITGDNSNIIDNMKIIIDSIDFISKDNHNKIHIIIKWCEKLNIDLTECAYIGDDILDESFIDLIGFTGCTSDTVQVCQKKAKYICKNKGGDGAVREFIERILEENQYIDEMNSEENVNIRKNGKITAVIPVRSGSTRCKNKNIREFGDTNLLKMKIEILKQVEEIDEIIVSSNCDEMLKIAFECSVTIEKRDPYYARTDTSGSEIFHYLANICKSEIMLYMHAVAPFVSVENIKKMIDIYRTNHNIDSVVSSNKINHFLWQDGKPLNYDPFNAVPSQYLENIYIPSFSPIINKTDFVKSTKSIIGKKPYFYELSQIEGIDIDTPYDFLVSELLYKNCFYDNDDIVNYLNRVDNIKTEMLDCTIRDGGYINNWNFTDEEVLECYKAVTQAGYDYFEIGFMYDKIDDKNGKWYSLTTVDIKNIYEKYNGCKIAVMIPIDNSDNIQFSDFVTTNISLIRLLLKLTNDKKKDDELIEKTNNYILQFKKLRYEVCLNLSSSDKYDKNIIDYVVSHFYDKDLKCIYLADTFGYLNEETTRKQLYNFQKALYRYNSKIPLGFHPHNNMGNALGKSKVALDFRVKMLDSTIYGLGRGAGNLQTEAIILELNRKYGNDKYDILPIIKYGDKYIRKFNDQYIKSSYIYGNSVLYTITGYFNIHPDYVKYICEKYSDQSIEDIYYCMIHIKTLNKNIFFNFIVDSFFKKNYSINNTNNELNKSIDVKKYIREITNKEIYSTEQIYANLKDCLKDRECAIFSCGPSIETHKEYIKKLPKDIIKIVIKTSFPYIDDYDFFIFDDRLHAGHRTNIIYNINETAIKIFIGDYYEEEYKGFYHDRKLSVEPDLLFIPKYRGSDKIIIDDINMCDYIKKNIIYTNTNIYVSLLIRLLILYDYMGIKKYNLFGFDDFCTNENNGLPLICTEWMGIDTFISNYYNNNHLIDIINKNKLDIILYSNYSQIHTKIERILTDNYDEKKNMHHYMIFYRDYYKKYDDYKKFFIEICKKFYDSNTELIEYYYYIFKKNIIHLINNLDKDLLYNIFSKKSTLLEIFFYVWNLMYHLVLLNINLPNDFNVIEYKKLNFDLQKLDDTDAILHYIKFGINEKRIYKLDIKN